MPTTEIVELPLVAGSDIGEPSNPAAVVLKEIGDTLAKVDGCQQVHFGTHVESPETVQMFINWDKIDSHHTFMKSETYGPFFKQVETVAGGPLSMKHVDFQPEGALSKALSAPVTEVATLYYGPDPPSGVEEGAAKFSSILRESGAEGLLDAAAGVAYEEIERDGVKGKGAVLVIGWESIEAHMAFRETATFKDNIHVFREGAKKIEMHHVAFMKFVS